MYRKHAWVWIVIMMFLLQLVQTEQVFSKSCNRQEWTIEIDANGDAHVQCRVTIDEAYCSYPICFEVFYVDNVVAWEVGTANPIKVTQTDKCEYTFEFDECKERGFQFIVECDFLETLREEFEWIYNPDSGSYEMGPSLGVYRFEWFLCCVCEASVTIILPKKYELLPGYYNPQDDTYYPDRVSISMDRLSALFVKDNPESEIFGFGVAFSKKGVELVEEGEKKFSLGQYDEAKLAYQEAITFYSKLPPVYGKDKDQLFAELQNRVLEIDDIIQQGADHDGDGYSLSEDCNDYDSRISPGAEELCDGKDNDCDGQIDEGHDKDGDGYTACGGDCDDSDPKIHPGAREPCGKDYNCDQQIEPCPTIFSPLLYGALLLVAIISVGLLIVVKRKQGSQEKGKVRKRGKRPETAKTLICPLCKNEIQEDWAACPHCGTKLKDDTRIY